MFSANVVRINGSHKYYSRKKKETDYTKDAFCGPALVELSDDGEILTLHNELPEGAKMVRKEISKEAFKRWTLRSKEKWNNK